MVRISVNQRLADLRFIENGDSSFVACINLALKQQFDVTMKFANDALHKECSLYILPQGWRGRGPNVNLGTMYVTLDTARVMQNVLMPVQPIR